MTKNTAANEDTTAIDPGGTKPAKGNAGGAGKKSWPAQKVRSGDRNTMPPEKK
jgi:hypothetical protein